MSFERLSNTLVSLIGISSTSGHEELIRDHLVWELTSLAVPSRVDGQGNLIATIPGNGRPLLLNAHMDRVPPGLGHRPVLRDGVIYSDGTTNLGADDAAGIAIILETLKHVLQEQRPHPPLVIVFTVQEETGLCGARNLEANDLQVEDGLVFDNAFEAGVVVSEGASYEAFDVEILGRTGHPGKHLDQTISAIEIFRQAHYPHGSLDNDRTRILIGKINGGLARNAVPGNVRLEGEIRSFDPTKIHVYKKSIQEGFEQAATKDGGSATVTFTTHSQGYRVDLQEPLLHLYAKVLKQRRSQLQTRPTFIGSDTSSFRPQIKAFTISTGVMNEHTVDEYVALHPLEQIVQDTLEILAQLTKYS